MTGTRKNLLQNKHFLAREKLHAIGKVVSHGTCFKLVFTKQEGHTVQHVLELMPQN